ncbi:replicative DNA helicase [Chelonobacter oris]|nr:replicative DNA helicase [Chelonobacter oris]
MREKQGAHRSKKNNGVIPKALHSEEMEHAVIGGLLIDNEQWDLVAEILQPRDFYVHWHRLAYELMGELLIKHKQVDILMLEQAFKAKHDQHKESGILAYLAEMVRNTPTSANTVRYANMLAQYSQRRQLYTLGQKLIVESPTHRAQNEFETLLDETEKTLFDIALRDNNERQPVVLSDAIEKVLDRIQRACDSKSAITGTASGLEPLDIMTSGFQPSEMVIVAARPSMGKTALALTLARNALELHNEPVHFYSMEMPADQIMQRLLSMVSCVPAGLIKNPLIAGDEDFAKLGEAIEHIKKWEKRLILDDSSKLTPHQLRTKVRRNIRLYGQPSAIFIDYLQIMSHPGKMNKYEEVTAISAELKALAKEIAVPVIVLAQLSRSSENRPDRRPILSDLRDSGAIEQDADLILLLHRDDYYQRAAEQKNGLSEVIIAKHRNGPTGNITCRFFGQYSKFEALVEAEIEQQKVDSASAVLDLLSAD